MKGKIIELESKNPYENIASEYGYYQEVEDEIILLLWQNTPCVVIGVNQNIYQEVNINYIRKNNILPVRRFTGGGSVYHDLGNLNFTIISAQKNKNMNLWMDIILKSLKNLGLNAYKEGRNDLLIGGKKFSGMAWLEDEEKFMVHGTLMVDLDLDVLRKCLTPDISKFEGKGIKSVKSRVLNLSSINKNINTQRLKEALKSEFAKVYKLDIECKKIEKKENEKVLEKLTSEDWIFVKDEKAQIQIYCHIEGKKVPLDIWIKNDKIEKVKIFTDSLKLDKVQEVRDFMIGKKYSDLDIEKQIKSIWN